MKLFSLIMIFIVTSCASNKPTPYQSEKKKEGYRDEFYEDLKVATFKANSYTKREKAKSYAEFRAIETCRGENKIANIIDVFDKTIEKEITRSSGTGWGPSYGFGMYPYYSRYSSFGLGVGMNTMSSNSWNETIVYPVLQVYYTCAEKVFRPQLIFKELSVEEMKHIVKDVKGAIQVEKIIEDSPNKSAVVEGDLVIKANGRRIDKVYELIRLFNKPDTVVTLQVLREGERVVTNIKGIDITERVKVKENEIISNVCADKKHKYQKSLKKRDLCH